jgi:hypothetical protein
MPLNKQTKQMCDSNKAKYGTGYDQVCLHLEGLLQGTAPNAAIRLTVKLNGRPMPPDQRRGRTLSSRARGAQPPTHHGPFQRWLGVGTRLRTDKVLKVNLKSLLESHRREQQPSKVTRDYANNASPIEVPGCAGNTTAHRAKSESTYRSVDRRAPKKAPPSRQSALPGDCSSKRHDSDS